MTCVRWSVIACILIVATSALQAQTSSSLITRSINLDVDLGSVSNGNGLDVKIVTAGSGQLGPQTANHGLNVRCTKANFRHVSGIGEIDCLNAVVRQDGQGDSSALQIDTQNTGKGFLAVQESVASSIAANPNRITHSIDIQEGVIPSGGDSYGYVATNNTGQANTMFLGQTVNKTHVGFLLRGLDNNTDYFHVDGKGNTSQEGDAYIRGRATLRSARVVTTPVQFHEGSYAITAVDCGVTLRDIAKNDHTYTVPAGLPLGCDVHVIQAGEGTVSFAAVGIYLEECLALGTRHITTGPFSEAELIIDSTKTALLRGDVH